MIFCTGFELEYYVSDTSSVSKVIAPLEVLRRELSVLWTINSTVTANETVDLEMTLVDKGTTTPAILPVRIALNYLVAC